MRDDIKKRREKYNIVTNAMRIFGGKELITRRDGMTREQFKYVSKIQNRAIKMLFPRPANPRIAQVMRPKQNYFLQAEVARRKAIKNGTLEEVKSEKNYFVDWLTKLFNLFRNVAVPQSI